MSVETAEIIFYSVTFVMVSVWLFGTRFALRRLRPAGPADGVRGRAGDADVLAGEAIIEGDPETLSRRVAEQLAAARSAAQGSAIKIVERTPERIAFEKVSGAGRVGYPFEAGLITLARVGERVRVRYADGRPIAVGHVDV